MPETDAQREARWATERARQAAYRNSPEAIAKRAARIANGQCVVDDGQCVTHQVTADLGHDLAINGTTREDGTARND